MDYGECCSESFTSLKPSPKDFTLRIAIAVNRYIIQKDITDWQK